MPSYVTGSDLSSYELGFCGAMAGIISRFVIAPLDVVKIRMQLQTHRTQFGSRITGDVKYLKISQAMKTILKEEGIKGLYKGNLPAEYLYLTYNTVEFWTYKELESFLESIDKEKRLPHAVKTFGCGMVAGCAATTTTYPFDLLRTRFALQSTEQHYTSIAQAVRSIYEKEGGMRGFYRGLWPAIIQIMPYMGLLFASYDAFAAGFKKLRDENVLSASYKPSHDMISGALSGFVSKTVIYPFDLVRKRLQVQGQTTEPWLRCLKSIVVKEGFKSLYKGLAPSLLKVAPANAVTFMVFEETKDLILLFKDNNPRCAT